MNLHTLAVLCVDSMKDCADLFNPSWHTAKTQAVQARDSRPQRDQKIPAVDRSATAEASILPHSQYNSISPKFQKDSRRAYVLLEYRSAKSPFPSFLWAASRCVGSRKRFKLYRRLVKHSWSICLRIPIYAPFMRRGSRSCRKISS